MEKDDEQIIFDQEEEEPRQITRKPNNKKYLVSLPYLFISLLFAYYFYKYAFKYPDDTACWVNEIDDYATAFQVS